MEKLELMKDNSDYSAIPMFMDFKERLNKLKKQAASDPVIQFPSDQDMEEWVIINMAGTKYHNPFNTNEENIEFIINIYRIGRTVGYMTRLDIEKQLEKTKLELEPKNKI